jgi:hypothetical protein
MITISTADTEMSRTSPETAFGSGFPITAFEDQCCIGPRMIMEIIWITFQELVQEDVEWETLTLFEEQIVAF